MSDSVTSETSDEESDVQEDKQDNPDEKSVINLVRSWGVTKNGVLRLLACGIKDIFHLKLIDPDTAKRLFSETESIGDFLVFRHGLEKWRKDNQFNPFDGAVVQSGDAVPQKFSLATLLKATIKGKLILKKKVTGLNNMDRNNLVQIIIENHLNSTQKKTISPERFTFYAKAIVDLFPAEEERLYYNPRVPKSKTNPTGKLYSKYKNSMSRYKGAFLHDVDPNGSSTSDDENVNMKPDNVNKDPLRELPVESEETLKDYEDWLKTHTEPWNLVLQKWKLSSKGRMEQMREDEEATLVSAFERWPLYKFPEGYSLIEIDFETLIPGVRDNLNERFGDLRQKLMPILDAEIKDNYNRKFYKQLLSHPDSDGDCLVALLINVLLPPERVGRKKKPTISDAQNEMIIHVKQSKDFEDTVDKMNIVGDPIQPRIIVIGERLTSLTQFLVYLDGVYYSLSSFAKCVALVIKICYVFNLEYSKTCRLSWEFFEKFIFNLNTEDVVSPKIQSLINSLA